MSSGSPAMFIGESFARCSRYAACCASSRVPSARHAWRSFIGVSIHPGAIAFTRTPCGASSMASVRESCATAALAVA